MEGDAAGDEEEEIEEEECKEEEKRIKGRESKAADRGRGDSLDPRETTTIGKEGDGEEGQELTDGERRLVGDMMISRRKKMVQNVNKDSFRFQNSIRNSLRYSTPDSQQAFSARALSKACPSSSNIMIRTGCCRVLR